LFRDVWTKILQTSLVGAIIQATLLLL
jgi:hypothetical protein